VRIVGLFLLGLLAFVFTVVWKFPAAGVLPHVNVEPVKLLGVQGSVWNGSAASVSNPQSPVDVENVNWKLQPGTLLSGNAGALVDFEVLGGKGEGLVKRSLAGDMSVSDGKLQIPAQELEQFLPLPIAKFAGVLLADIEEITLENNLLKRTQGKLIWSSAQVDSQMAGSVKLGQVVFDIVPDGEEQHVGKLSNTNGQLELNGEVLLDQAGNFNADIRIRPTAETPASLNGVLGFLGARESDGSYRLRQRGNINNYM